MAQPRFLGDARITLVGGAKSTQCTDVRRAICVAPYRNNSLRGKRAAPTSKVTNRERPR